MANGKQEELVIQAVVKPKVDEGSLKNTQEKLKKALVNSVGGWQTVQKQNQAYKKMFSDVVKMTHNQKQVMYNNLFGGGKPTSEEKTAIKQRLLENQKMMQEAMRSAMTHNQKQAMYEQLFGADPTMWDRLKASLSDISEKFKGMANRGAKALGIDLKKAFENFSESVEEAKSRANNFFNAVKRIAIYRAIRWALKEMTQAFQEGRENAYQWAKLVGNQFAKSMDMLATSALYAKNSLGALTMPLTNYLAPIVDALTDKFVALVNVINQFIAVATGATSWVMALKYPKEYLEDAVGSAKELKNQLLGFDELNVLQAPNGGAGSAGMDYSEMFKDMQIDAEIKKRFAKIQAIVGTFALALGALLLPAKPLLAIGLLALGAKSIASSVSVAWDAVGSELQAKFSWITGIISTFVLALGVFALAGGQIQLGIPLIIAGASGLISTIAVNWNGIVSWVKSGLEKIGATLREFLENVKTKFLTSLQNAKETVKTWVSNLISSLKLIGAEGLLQGNAFINGFYPAIKQIADWIKEVFGKTYNLTVTASHPHSSTGEYYETGNQGNSVTGSGNSHQHGAVEVPLFANGGFPTRGTMFYAGENGAEFVGQVGGRTGVYNADEMTVALADANEGVIATLAEVGNAIINAINNKDTSLNINDVRVALKNSNLRYGV